MSKALEEAEDHVSLFINGGRCMRPDHPAATDLEILIMLRMLRTLYPHQSTDVILLQHEIDKELKKS